MFFLFAHNANKKHSTVGKVPIYLYCYVIIVKTTCNIPPFRSLLVYSKDISIR